MTYQMKNYLLWFIALILFSEFMVDGFDKLQGHDYFALRAWGYSCSFIAILGFGEIVLASGLLIPKSRKWAAMFIFALTLVSTFVFYAHQDIIGLLISVMNIGLAAIVIWYGSNLSHAH